MTSPIFDALSATGLPDAVARLAGPVASAAFYQHAAARVEQQEHEAAILTAMFRQAEAARMDSVDAGLRGREPMYSYRGEALQNLPRMQMYQEAYGVPAMGMVRYASAGAVALAKMASSGMQKQAINVTPLVEGLVSNVVPGIKKGLMGTAKYVGKNAVLPAVKSKAFRKGVGLTAAGGVAYGGYKGLQAGKDYLAGSHAAGRIPWGGTGLKPASSVNEYGYLDAVR